VCFASQRTFQICRSISNLSQKKNMSLDNDLTWTHYPDELAISLQSISIDRETDSLIYIKLRNQTLKLGMEENVSFKMDFHKMLFDTLKV
jgi:hypothetical protein